MVKVGAQTVKVDAQTSELAFCSATRWCAYRRMRWRRPLRPRSATSLSTLAATFEGEFSDVTRSYTGKGVARYAWRWALCDGPDADAGMVDVPGFRALVDALGVSSGMPMRAEMAFTLDFFRRIVRFQL